MNKFVHIPNIPTRWKITGLAFGIVAFTLLIIGIILIGYLLNVKEDQLSHRAMITGQLVAQNPVIQQNIESEHAADILQSVVDG